MLKFIPCHITFSSVHLLLKAYFQLSDTASVGVFVIYEYSKNVRMKFQVTSNILKVNFFDLFESYTVSLIDNAPSTDS